MTDIVDVVARAIYEGRYPAGKAIADPWDHMSEVRKEIWRPDARVVVRVLRVRLAETLNSYLINMKPDMDDSVTGFNEAWDVMRKVLET